MGSLTVGIKKLSLGIAISVAFRTWVIAKNQPKKHLQKSGRTGEFSCGGFPNRMIGKAENGPSTWEDLDL